MWNVVPAVRCRVSTLPPPSWGGNGMNGALAIGAVAHGAAERHDRDLDAGHERRRRAAAQVERAHEAVGEVLGQQAELGQDRAPAPLARLQREDLDRERVAGLRALDVNRPREVVERVEVERAVPRSVAPSCTWRSPAMSRSKCTMSPGGWRAPARGRDPRRGGRRTRRRRARPCAGPSSVSR